jgi:hypothetical protein
MSEEIKIGDRVEVIASPADLANVSSQAVSGETYTVELIDDPDSGPDGGVCLREVERGPWVLRRHVRLAGSAPAASPIPPNPKALYGAQKPDLSLIPPVALAHAALALEEGARKYGAFNWRDSPVEARTYIAAALRHLGDYADRTDHSSDADVHNLGHVIACCAILLDATEGGHLIDNRATVPGKSAEVLDRLKNWKIERAKGAAK